MTQALPQENSLIVVAEVAIALAGFSSIVIALRGRRDDTTSFAYIRLWRLIETSLATVAFALLPFALYHLDITRPQLWRTASACFGAYVLGAQLYMFVRWWDQWRSPAIPWSFNGPVLALQITVVLLLASNALGIGDGDGFGRYFVALLWYLVLSALYFGRLLLLKRQGDEQAEEPPD